MKKVLGNLTVLAVGCIIALGLLELFLRWAQPIPNRIKGDKIVLPHNQLYQFTIPTHVGLDTVIKHRKNALGFRGPEVPDAWDSSLTIIAVGGSTTECYLISDGNDWPALVQNKLQPKYHKVWVNNAGLDGHSTFGHQLLLNDYILPLKPDFVLFLLGANEVGRTDLDQYDKAQFKQNLSAWKRTLYHSEVVSFILNIQRAAKADELDLNHQYLQLQTLEHRPTDSLAIMAQIKSDSITLRSYHTRIQNLIDSCQRYHIQPIFITQPSLLGVGVDPDTRIDLSTVAWNEANGASYWRRLEAYNNVLKEAASQNDVFCIDLAHLLPKRSAYFYDNIHYTNDGSEAVSKIIAEKLAAYLASQAESF
ncbi:MAG: SGNH/GDSL hydrolase family protein [Bacteroidota bacterium]